MESKSILDTIGKYGVRGILVLVIVWMNDRLNTVEDKMYKCFDDKEVILKNRLTNNNRKVFYVKPRLEAILPTEEIQERHEKVLC